MQIDAYTKIILNKFVILDITIKILKVS